MNHRYSLAQLMAMPYSPPQMLQLAAACGLQDAGIRLLPASPGGPAYDLMADAAMRRETLAVQRGTGVRVFDLEVARILPDFSIAQFSAFFAVGQQLGAAHILVAGDDPDEARLTANYARFCEEAARHGLTADLEFMPWTQVNDLPKAKRIVQAAQQPNAGVLVDALHFARSGSRLEDLAGIPRHWLNYAQICDGAVPGPASFEGMIFDARCERMLPGEGGIGLRALFATLPQDIVVSVEVPSDSRAPKLGYEAWAKRALAAARCILENGLHAPA